MSAGRLPTAAPTVAPEVTLGEGRTPLVRLHRLERELALGALWAKLESTNPTGSYKDRIAAATVSALLDRGARGWIATSSGNGGSAFAAYGRRAGVAGLLLVAEHPPREKLIPALVTGTRVLRIVGLGDGGTAAAARALFAAVGRIAERFELEVAVTAHRYNEHGMHACDAIAAEILDAGGVPDAVYVPTSGGGLLAAVTRGFLERGAPTATVCAQPSGCAPVVRHLHGESAAPVVEDCHTAISGLQLADPPDGALACELTRRSGGWGTAVPDEEIFAAQRLLARTEGIFVEPAAATALASLLADRRAGAVNERTTAVLLCTGSGLKDLSTAERAVDPAPAVTLDELDAAAASALGA